MATEEKGYFSVKCPLNGAVESVLCHHTYVLLMFQTRKSLPYVTRNKHYLPSLKAHLNKNRYNCPLTYMNNLLSW